MTNKLLNLMTVGTLTTTLLLSGIPSVYAMDLESSESDIQDDEIAFTLNNRDKHLLLHADELEAYPEASRGEIERMVHSNASAQGVESRAASASRGSSGKSKGGNGNGKK